MKFSQRQRREGLEARLELRGVERGPDRVDERQEPDDAEQPGGRRLEHAVEAARLHQVVTAGMRAHR
jgi:hypothetical protein